MFQFPALALPCLYIQQGVMPCYRHCVSAFRNLRINACLPASRSLSQAAASFFASRCQDIHRTPLVSLTSWIEDRSHANFNLLSQRSPPRTLKPSFTKGLLRQQVLERCPLKTERPSTHHRQLAPPITSLKSKIAGIAEV